MVITAPTIEQKSCHTASRNVLNSGRVFRLGAMFYWHDENLYSINRTQIHGFLQVFVYLVGLSNSHTRNTNGSLNEVTPGVNLLRNHCRSPNMHVGGSGFPTKCWDSASAMRTAQLMFELSPRFSLFVRYLGRLFTAFCASL